jgi:CRISPR/Cas system Type II protein with McrA/HNH and RuvC-like nuclease domain
MSVNKSTKKYIYFRDMKKCFFCSKKLKFNQISLDHYLPSSKGGTDDVFNMVLSCDKCNINKRDTVPNEWEKLLIENLKKGIEDYKITSKIKNKYKYNELLEIAHGINKIESINGEVVFQSNSYRIYIKNNKIRNIIHLNITERRDEI